MVSSVVEKQKCCGWIAQDFKALFHGLSDVWVLILLSLFKMYSGITHTHLCLMYFINIR